MRFRPTVTLLTCAATIGVSMSVLPFSTAGDVSRNKNRCTISFTSAEIQDLASGISSQTSTMDRLQEKFPGGADLIEFSGQELLDQMINTNTYNPDALSDEASLYFDIFRAHALADFGVLKSESAYLLYAAVSDDYFTYWFNEKAPNLVGSRTLNKNQAEREVSNLQSFYPRNTIESSIRNDMMDQIIRPRMEEIQTAFIRLSAPYQACVDAKTGWIELSPDSQNGDHGGTGGNDTNGSSFGSS